MNAKPLAPVEIGTVVGLTHEGAGIVRDGKTVFVMGALPGERISFRRAKRHRQHDEALLVEVLEPAAERAEPRCAHFGVCGGCSLQHLAPEQQLKAKEAELRDNLERIGHTLPEKWLEPMHGPVWNYRRRARLGAKYVGKKGKVVVGFRERSAPYVADIQVCHVLAEPLASLIEPLGAMLMQLDIRDRMPQIEVAIADNATALVFRVLNPPSERDLQVFRNFEAQYGVRVYLQPAGLDSITRLRVHASENVHAERALAGACGQGEADAGATESAVAGGAVASDARSHAGSTGAAADVPAGPYAPAEGVAVQGSVPGAVVGVRAESEAAAALRGAVEQERESPLHYRLPDFDLTLEFAPTDFIQINGAINRSLVSRAVELLELTPESRVLDLFCGLGNFTLALARRAGHVVGVEGDAGLIERARHNARRNGITNAEFHVANLAEAPEQGTPWARGPFTHVLLDPPRVGAREVLAAVARFKPQRVLYISCHPGSLARDIGILVQDHGYALRAAGVLDMFPHTNHVESLAVLEPN